MPTWPTPPLRFDPAAPLDPPAQGAAADVVVDHDEAVFLADDDDDAFDDDDADFADTFDPADDAASDDDGEQGTQGTDTAYDDAAAEDDDEQGTLEEGAATAGDDAHRGAQGAPVDHERNVQPPPYNLRLRAPATERRTFNQAMDNPHDGKSYHGPNAQFLQTALTKPPQYNMDHERRLVFNFILAQMATTWTQMSERAGLRKHGKAAEAALMREFSQLEDLDVYEPLDPTKLTRRQKKEALRALNFLKEKRNGTLKGRTCADGRSQRTLYDKSQTASPTVSTDALMLSIIVDAFERRDTATADVAGAYLKAFMDDFVIMKFVGASVAILCQLNPNHKRFVTIENGVEVLYVRLIKALYGCIKSALLWYDLFTTNLEDLGFKLNPYDQLPTVSSTANSVRSLGTSTTPRSLTKTPTL